MNARAIQNLLRTILVTLMLSVLLLPAISSAKTAVPQHTSAFYVNDFANVIDEKAENYMVNYGIKLHQASGAQVVLVTVNSTEGISMEQYATALFNSWGVGDADKNNGILLLMSIKDDDYWAVQGKGIEQSMPNSKIKEILSKYLEPDFAAKTYSNGARKTYGAFIQAMGGTWIENVSNKNYVSDNAGILKKVTKDYLNESSNRYMATTGSGVYVVTVKNAGDKTLQDYTTMKFNSIGAGSKDVMLVLDIGGDNYHVVQGKDIDKILTNEVIGNILDTALEPYFAKKDYGSGATATANAFYSFFLARADQSQTKSGSNSEASSSAGVVGETGDISTGKGILILSIFAGVVSILGITATRRNRYLEMYGLPFNPYSQRNVRRYGPWYGQSDYGYGRRWHRRYYHHHHHHHRNTSSNNSKSSFWGNSGGGGSTNGGGAGRSSSSSYENSGGGGSSSGGGAGRYSSDSSDSYSSGSGNSSGGGSSGGGGNASSGGGVGRH